MLVLLQLVLRLVEDTPGVLHEGHSGSEMVPADAGPDEETGGASA